MKKYIQIFIETSVGTTLPLQLTSSQCTIYELKQELKKKQHNISNLRLVYCGQTLKDHCTLDEYRIVNGAIVRSTFQYRIGGVFGWRSHSD